jgi:hypothetical protein
MAARIAQVLILLASLLILFTLKPFSLAWNALCQYQVRTSLGLDWNTTVFDHCGMYVNFLYEVLLPNLIAAPFLAWCVWRVSKSVWASKKVS